MFCIIKCSSAFAPVALPVRSVLQTKHNMPRPFSTTAPTLQPSITFRHFSPKTKRFTYPTSNVAPPGSPLPRRIAVVGGGLAGLAFTYHLLHSTSRFARKRNIDPSQLHISLFDPSQPGTDGASAAAAGLLHPFRPRPKTKMWNHQKAMDAATHLLARAQTVASSSYPLLSTPGILKVALDARSEEDFRIAANRFPHEVEFFSPDQLTVRFPNVHTARPALYIRSAHVVDTHSYMKALWFICQESGRVTWVQQAISSVSQLFNSSFDNVILCSGAQVKQVSDLSSVPITPCLGRNLILDSSKTPPSVPLLSGLYVVPRSNATAANPSLVAGATFEYDTPHQPTAASDVDAIIRSFHPKMNAIFPGLFEDWKVSAIQSGVRAIPPRSELGSIPIVCKVEGTPPDRSCWMLTGLGGRGLLYHAFLARRLAHAVIAGTDKHIPGETKQVKIHFSPP